MLPLLTACSEASSGIKAEGSSNASSAKNNEPKEKSAINDDPNKKVNLKLQLLKRDEAAGVTIENNDLYQLVNDEIKKNPQKGEGKGFILYFGDIFTKKSGEKSVLVFVINRYDNPNQYHL